MGRCCTYNAADTLHCVPAVFLVVGPKEIPRTTNLSAAGNTVHKGNKYSRTVGPPKLVQKVFQLHLPHRPIEHVAPHYGMRPALPFHLPDESVVTIRTSGAAVYPGERWAEDVSAAASDSVLGDSVGGHDDGLVNVVRDEI